VWPAVEALAAALSRREEIPGDEAKEIMAAGLRGR
jgi:hypothetical protein